MAALSFWQGVLARPRWFCATFTASSPPHSRQRCKRRSSSSSCSSAMVRRQRFQSGYACQLVRSHSEIPESSSPGRSWNSGIIPRLSFHLQVHAFLPVTKGAPGLLDPPWSFFECVPCQDHAMFCCPCSKQDTAGQERFHALGPIYYRDADGE